MEMCSGAHTKSGTAHRKMCSDVQTSHIKVILDVHTMLGWGHRT